MAAATAMAIAGGVSAISSGALAIGGNKRRKRAEAELRNLVPPELRNYYSDVPVSTMGSRIASQNMAQNNSNMLVAGQRGGIRALSAIAPTLTEANIQQNQAIAQDIDRQYRENKMNEAQGGMQVQGMQEQRYQGALAGLQAERAAGLQDTYTGIQGIGSSIMGAAVGMNGVKGSGGGSTDGGGLGLNPATLNAINQPIDFNYQSKYGGQPTYETMIKPQMQNFNTIQSDFTGQSYNMPGYNAGYNNAPLNFQPFFKR